jgi:hypothetical protein
MQEPPMIPTLSSQDASSSSRYTFGLPERQGAALCIALLAAASLVATFPLACATPFAAFAVVAALMLPLRSALLATATVWLINQVIGFGLIGYPWTANAAYWGIVLAAAALLATVTAEMVLERVRLHVALTALVALSGSYLAYELVVLAASSVLGGEEAMALDIVARVGLLNLAWMAGLLGALELIRLAIAARAGSTAQA